MTFVMAVIGAALGFFLSRNRAGANMPFAVVGGAAGAVIGGWVLKSLFSILGFVALFVGAGLGAILAIWAIAKFVEGHDDRN